MRRQRLKNNARGSGRWGWFSFLLKEAFSGNQFEPGTFDFVMRMLDTVLAQQGR